jgi:rhamnose transport system substrate-binding protein
MKNVVPRLMLVCSACVVIGCNRSSTPDSGIRIGMMPKLVGIAFFDAAERGAREAADELGLQLVYDGPTDARSEDQIRMLDGWLAQGFDVLAVAPNDPEGISRTLKSARDAGATVLTWDTDANPELSTRQVFVNQAESQAIAFALVDVMAEGIQARGEQLAGDYLIVSGTPTAANQNVWMDFMRQRIEDTYPDMKLLPHLIPGEDQQKAQEQTAEAISAHPQLKGIWGITTVSLPAAAKATRDADEADQIYVTGVSLPSMMREFVQDGTVEKFVLWDVVDLGYLTVHIAKRLHDGTLEKGTFDIGRVKGVEVRESEVILGTPIVFDKSNIDDYSF